MSNKSIYLCMVFYMYNVQVQHLFLLNSYGLILENPNRRVRSRLQNIQVLNFAPYDIDLVHVLVNGMSGLTLDRFQVGNFNRFI